MLSKPGDSSFQRVARRKSRRSGATRLPKSRACCPNWRSQPRRRPARGHARRQGVGDPFGLISAIGHNLSMLPTWGGRLASLYWFKRACRSDACRRRWYRKIADEKKRQLQAGVEYIELHLVTRYLANPRNQNAQWRLQNYYAQGRLFA